MLDDDRRGRKVLKENGFLVEAFVVSSATWKNVATLSLYDARIRW